MIDPLALLSDPALIASLKALVGQERRRSADILRHLAEMDRRDLAKKSGYPSLFEYCVAELRYSHGTTAKRIHAARAAKKFKILLKTVERGLLSISTIALMAPHLKWENHRELIRRASGRSTREVEALVASLSPAEPAPRERVRFLPATPPVMVPPPEPDLFRPPAAPRPAGSSEIAPAAPVDDPPPAPRTTAVEPTVAARAQPTRVLYSFTADQRFFLEVERAKDLMRHQNPTGCLEEVFAAAVDALLTRIDPLRRAAKRAAKSARFVAAGVRDAVWARDGGRCAYRSADGKVCGATGGLELDHVVPIALGGLSTPENLRLLCRAHNAYEGRRAFAAPASRGP